jgi:hypothetical protein
MRIGVRLLLVESCRHRVALRRAYVAAQIWDEPMVGSVTKVYLAAVNVVGGA